MVCTTYCQGTAAKLFHSNIRCICHDFNWEHQGHCGPGVPQPALDLFKSSDGFPLQSTAISNSVFQFRLTTVWYESVIKVDKYQSLHSLQRVAKW